MTVVRSYAGPKNNRRFLETVSVSRFAMGYALAQPEYSPRTTCVAFSLPSFSFRTMMKSVATLSPNCITSGSIPRSASGSARLAATRLRYIRLLWHVGHAGFLGKCDNLLCSRLWASFTSLRCLASPSSSLDSLAESANAPSPGGFAGGGNGCGGII